MTKSESRKAEEHQMQKFEYQFLAVSVKKLIQRFNDLARFILNSDF